MKKAELLLQTEIERLKRQIAEKEAAKRAARAQTPTVTKVTASCVFVSALTFG